MLPRPLRAAAVRLRGRRLARFPPWAEGDERVAFDVRDLQACREHAHDVAAIIHCAGVVGPARSRVDPLQTLAVNVTGTANLLDAAHGVRGSADQRQHRDALWSPSGSGAASRDRPDRPADGLRRQQADGGDLLHRAPADFRQRRRIVPHRLRVRARHPDRRILPAPRAGRRGGRRGGRTRSFLRFHLRRRSRGSAGRRRHSSHRWRIRSTTSPVACCAPAASSPRPSVALVPGARIEQGPGVDPARHLRGPCVISRARDDFGWQPRFTLESGLADWLSRIGGSD